MWVKVLRGLEEPPSPTLPTKDNTVFQHPRVAVSSNRSPLKLLLPACKTKFQNATALAEQYEKTISRYQQQGWHSIYPDGSSEKHLEVGWVGGYGLFPGDDRDTAEFIRTDEDQTNNCGELRAELCSLQGHRLGHRSLICPNSLLVVNRVLGWVQRWQHHKWCNTTGKVKHINLWTQILDIMYRLGDKVKWLHVPSHIGIKGNRRADHLADVGRPRFPLLFGRISIRPHPADEEHAPPPPRARSRVVMGLGRTRTPPAHDANMGTTGGRSSTHATGTSNVHTPKFV